MKELIKINYQTETEPTVSGRDLHEFLEVGADYRHWFPRMCEYGFTEGQDFNTVKIDRVQTEGGREVSREVTDHLLTFSMAKELCMIQRNEKGKQARQYFIQLEKDWNSPEKVMARALQIADRKIKMLESKVQEDAPKVEFFDAVADSKTAIPMGEVAKILDRNIGRNKLFAILRKKKILMGSNIPYQTYIDAGYFRVVEAKYTKPNGDVCINVKTLVLQKGVDYIRKVLREK